MFLLGFKFLQIRGIYSKMVCGGDDDDDHGGGGRVKNTPLRVGTTRVLCKVCGDQKFEEINEVLLRSNCGNLNLQLEEEVLDGNEDEMFDVMSLRKMVKAERRKVYAARSELEKERMAASSSVDEAMAMILRLQNEKSSLQIQANQMERVAEEKQSHDQEVIQSLQWIIMKHESERSLLEDQLRLCRDKLRGFIKGEEWDQFDSACPTPSASYSSFGTIDHDNGVIGALDFESSPMRISYKIEMKCSVIVRTQVCAVGFERLFEGSNEVYYLLEVTASTSSGTGVFMAWV